VCADSQPHDVRFGGEHLLAVTEGGSAIGCPGHLPDVLASLHSLNAQPRSELRGLSAKPGHKLIACGQEGTPLLAAQLAHVAGEARRALVGRRHPGV
jgi:hypothetical protein